MVKQRLKGNPLLLFIGTGAYSGYAPVMPGTFGSAVGAVVYFFLFSAFNSPVYFISVVALYFLGVYIADHIDRENASADNPAIVIDEIFGMLITCYGCGGNLGYVLAGFVLFRVFDVVKTFPANTIDRKMKNGHGIMLDDLVAGIYGWTLMYLVRMYW